MAEFTGNLVQTVAVGRDVLFSETPICGSGCIVYRTGSGVVTLRGNTNQCKARYKITFGGNISIPTGGTAAPISISIAVNSEPLSSATAIVTPTVINAFFNVSASVFVEVPKGCCYSITTVNTSTQPINVQNANLIVERVA